MTILASFDIFVRIEFDSAKHSTDLLSPFRFGLDALEV